MRILILEPEYVLCRLISFRASFPPSPPPGPPPSALRPSIISCLPEFFAPHPSPVESTRVVQDPTERGESSEVDEKDELYSFGEFVLLRMVLARERNSSGGASHGGVYAGSGCGWRLSALLHLRRQGSLSPTREGSAPNLGLRRPRQDVYGSWNDSEAS